jgi:hypothetical protein
VESEPGRGTTVRVFLPLVEPLDRTTPASGGQSVLLLEPDEFNRKVLRRLLESLGYPVLTAVDASGALELARRPGYRFDLLFAPEPEDGSGEGLMEGLRAAQPDLKRVVLEHAGLPGDPREPGRPRLVPPYDVEHVSAVIRTALSDGA